MTLLPRDSLTGFLSAYQLSWSGISSLSLDHVHDNSFVHHALVRGFEWFSSSALSQQTIEKTDDVGKTNK